MAIVFRYLNITVIMLEQLLDTKTILAFFLIAFAVYYIVTRVKEHLDIVRLGGYAPRVRGFLPLGTPTIVPT